MTLYTTGCPKCKVLETLLERQNIEYNICDDVDLMIKMGMSSAPVLEDNGKLMPFIEAYEYIKNMKKGDS